MTVKALLVDIAALEAQINEPVILRLFGDGSADIVRFMGEDEPICGFDKVADVVTWLHSDETTRKRMNAEREIQFEQQSKVLDGVFLGAQES